jgi:hypothetical protein
MIKKISYALISIFCAACSSAPSQPGITAQAATPYVTKSYKATNGTEINLLKCNSGTINCEYNWATLCKVGVAKNADPEGNLTETPGYFPDKDGVRMRIFVCK